MAPDDATDTGTAPGGPDRRPSRSLPEGPVVGRAVAAGRVGIGIAALGVPGRVVRWQLGGEQDPHGARMFTRMLGIRDLALGAVTLAALDKGRATDARRLLWLGAACDLVDGLVILREPAMGRRLRRAIGLVALLAAAGGALQASQLPPGDDEDAATVTSTS